MLYRYADRAKQIVCKAIVNEDANAKLIRELKEEIFRLKQLLVTEGILSEEITRPIDQGQPNQTNASNPPPKHLRSRSRQLSQVNSIEENQLIHEQIEQSEKLITELNETWEEKLKKSEQVKVRREQVLGELGFVFNEVGVFSPQNTPHLVNLNEDPLMSECLIYYTKAGATRVGRGDADVLQDIQLSGSRIEKQHCWFDNQDGRVTLHPCGGALCYVNGMPVQEPVLLRTGCRVILGKHHVFRFQNPQEAREKAGKSGTMGTGGSECGQDASEPTEQLHRTGMDPNPVDWNFAQLELYEKQGIDLKQEMERKFIQLMEQCRKEKEEAANLFQQQRQTYEQTIESLQRKVNEQNMTISMYSSTMLGDDESIGGFLQRSASDVQIAEVRRLVFEDLRNEREVQLCRKVIRKWKPHQFTSLRDDLWGNAIFLKEANALSAELKKRVQFQFTLIQNPNAVGAGTLSSGGWKLSDEFLRQLEPQCVGVGMGAGSEPVGNCSASWPRTLVAVEVQDLKNGAIHFWSLAKLR